MGTLLSVLSSSTTASAGTHAAAASERSNKNGRSFPAVSVSPSSTRVPRTRKTFPGRNTKLYYKRKGPLTSQEISILEEACVSDEIKIIRQQILKEGIRLDDRSLPCLYCYPEGKQQDAQSVTMPFSEKSALPLFAGSVVIQKSRIQALSYALSEYKLRGRIPNRIVYWVNGSVVQNLGQNNVSGIAVVSKSRDEGSPFPWRIQGYKVHGNTGCPDIELLAILEALQIAFDEVSERRLKGDYGKQQIVVIYSDCQEALNVILHHLTRTRRNGTHILLQGVISLATVLRSVCASVELHWVPGHRDVPGNYLAEYVARRAWDKTFRFELTTSEEAICRDYRMRMK